MAVKIEARNGWLCYRVYYDGWKGRESTGCRATTKNRERLERKAQAMSDLMAEGRFDYLAWFPDGNRAALYRPAPPPEAVQVPTVRAYAEDTWLPRMTPPAVRASLEKTYRKHLTRHLLPAFGTRRLSEVARGDLLDFRGLLTRSEREGGKGLKMKTARDMIDGTFRALFRDARRDGLVTGDPFADLDWPRKVRPEPDPFTEEERDLLVAHFWDRDRHYYPLVFTMFWTGLRTGEATGLRWGAVDLRRARLKVRVSRTLGEDNPPKTEKSTREIALLPEVVAVLRNAQPLHATADTFVFPTQAGTPLDEERFVEKHWHRALRATKVRPRKFYATRHTFITVAASRPGINLKWLADYCGTSVEMIEKHYAGAMQQDEAQLTAIAGQRRQAAHAEGVA
jgi:integrase